MLSLRASQLKKPAGGGIMKSFERETEMTMRRFPKHATPVLILAAILASGAPPGGAPAAQTSRLNLLLITVDTLRADRLGGYGSRLVSTPAIDGLAARGVLFTR